VAVETPQLIRKMSRDNPLWRYMVRGAKPPSQTWRTFLANHLKSAVSVEFFTVPTIRFQELYVFLVLAHDRRWILHFAVRRLIQLRNGPRSNCGRRFRRTVRRVFCCETRPHLRECLEDHAIFNKATLHRHLKLFLEYYHARTHLSLEMNAERR
jgi:hypothetical protein